MAIEQTLFSIQRSVLQPKAVPALFSQYQWLLSDLFIILTVHPAGMSIVLSPSAFSFKTIYPSFTGILE